MEYQKITNLLGNTLDKVPRFITKKWIEVHDQSGETDNTICLNIVKITEAQDKAYGITIEMNQIVMQKTK